MMQIWNFNSRYIRRWDVISTSCDTCNDDGTVNSEGGLDGICESCSDGVIVDNDSDDDSVLML